MNTERPSGPTPAPELRRLEVRPLGGLQELREVLTEARRADRAPRGSDSDAHAPRPVALADLLAALESEALAPPASFVSRLRRAFSGRFEREARERRQLLSRQLREVLRERERREATLASLLEELRARLEELERGQAELRSETRRLDSELTGRRGLADVDVTSPS